MSPLLLGASALLYVGVACGFARNGHPGLVLAWTCYAGANVGFIWDTLQGGKCAL